MGERVPKSGCSSGEGSVTEGFESGWWYTQSERVGGWEGSGGAMGDKEVRQVGWGQVMESFEGQEEYFEVNALFDRESVELLCFEKCCITKVLLLSLLLLSLLSLSLLLLLLCQTEGRDTRLLYDNLSKAFISPFHTENTHYCTSTPHSMTPPLKKKKKKYVCTCMFLLLALQ